MFCEILQFKLVYGFKYICSKFTKLTFSLKIWRTHEHNQKFYNKLSENFCTF